MTLGFARILGGRGRTPVLLQSEASECGLACLGMVAAHFGHRIDLGTLRRRHPISTRGATLTQLMDVAHVLDLSSRAVRFDLPDLKLLRLPAVLHWDMSHFVVLEAVTSRGITVLDPAVGRRRITHTDASRHVTGVALELTPTAAFAPRQDASRLGLREAIGPAPGLKSTLAQILLLSFGLELFALVSPLYLQLVVDEAISRGDVDLLTVLAIGFALLVIVTVAIASLRSLVLLRLQTLLGLQVEARLFRHLLHLPLRFFETRHIGDVLSRLSSVAPVRKLVAEGLVAAVLDGVMATLTLLMLLLYSPLLTLVSLAALAGYAGLRFALYRPLRERSEEGIRTAAFEESAVIDTLRAMQAIKLAHAEREREGRWLSQASIAANAQVRIANLQLGFKTANDLIFGLEAIIAVYIAARLAMDGIFSVGMIFAYMTYKQQFVGKTVLLIERLFDYRIIQLHLERLSEIALAERESGAACPAPYRREVRGSVALVDLGFRHAETEASLFDGVDLDIRAGEFVVITGRSGAGKTTLIKLMTGLLDPTQGSVLVDGTPLRTFGLADYRSQIGVVMQDDQLMSGTIADNISFFDTNFDVNAMLEAAHLAGIHHEIMSMPMTYNSFVGDVGSTLSGGQRQRVLLARALYRRPRILFMDEGTAFLDEETEVAIARALRDLSITRIYVAHRPAARVGADRVVRLEDGRIVGAAAPVLTPGS
ncbi:peptidase domain-containing ABC transporter [Methylobacterium oryzisoli]|uniref:peptidase domain-containing ABC transporter n=1 Tax=Methylobacterium oryzisoli TaxID=3385502 RepID=UPI003892B94A